MMKGLVFDMDGLMIDSERLYFETERELAGDFGLTVPDSLMVQLMGRSPLESMEIFVEKLHIPASPVALLELRQKIVEEKLNRQVLPMKGLYEIVSEFSSTFRLAIATGSPLRFVEIVLRKLDLQRRFGVLQTHEDISCGKPHPEIYEKVAAKMGILPQECIVLEDSHNGALAAIQAGCYCIAVPNEYTSGQDFGFVHFHARDLLEARDHIKGIK